MVFRQPEPFTTLRVRSLDMEVEPEARGVSVDGENALAVPGTSLVENSVAPSVASSSHFSLPQTLENCFDVTPCLMEKAYSDDQKPPCKRLRLEDTPGPESPNCSKNVSVEIRGTSSRLLASFSCEMTTEWLQKNGFQKYTEVFADFNGEECLFMRYNRYC